jgi:hypothetical protein
LAKDYEEVPEGHREVGDDGEGKPDLVHQLGGDGAALERARKRWAELRRGRPKPRRGLFGEYFPSTEGIGGSIDAGKPDCGGVARAPVEDLRLDLGPTEDGSEPDAA